MSERSILRLRAVPHIAPDRQDEAIIEVWRDDFVVATIYGSREGVHIVSDRFTAEQPPPLHLDQETFSAIVMTGWVIPLLAPGEPCPWCLGVGQMMMMHIPGATPRPCPLCRRADV